MRVEALGVSRTFPGEDGTPVRAVDGVSLEAEPGETLVLAGRSGSGKTTLLFLLGGIDEPTEGRVVLDRADLARTSRGERTRLARSVGFVLQGSALLRRMPLWENVTQGLVPLGVPADERRDRAESLLGRVGIGRLAERRPEQLSAGERQRAALARALALAPRLLLADEPTSDLDPESAEVVRGVLAGEAAAGRTVVVATHDDAILARAGRVLRMREGRIVPDR
jgi:putative ABC transport system ATP-binding protein